MQDMKMQNVKMTDQTAGREIAKPENAGHQNGRFAVSCLAISLLSFGALFLRSTFSVNPQPATFCV